MKDARTGAENAKVDPAQSAQIFDQHARSYSDEINKSLSKFGAEHDFFTNHKAWLIPHLLREAGKIPSDLDVLDVGCGTANLHAPIRGIFRSISGTDVSAASLEVAAAAHPENAYRLYDGHALPYADSSFDLAFAICVFHHVPPSQWQALAGEMLRVVRKGGQVIILEHNPFNPLTRHIVRTCPLDVDAVLLTPSKVRSLLQAAGGSDVSTRAILNIPPKGKFLQKLDLSVGVLPVGAQYIGRASKR